MSDGQEIRSRKPGARRGQSGAIGACVLAGVLAIVGAVRGDWLMGRGNLGRTGTEEMRAPEIKSPKVVWAFKAQEHFVASPVPGADLVIVSGLGAFNTGQIHAVAVEDMVGAGSQGTTIRAGTPVWNKSSPFITLPTVSAPAVYGGMVIMGDGMHQTDGAVLYNFDLRTGRPLWRYEMEGKLVHMEGAPVVDPTFPGGPAAFIGAGNGGVLAVSVNRAVLEGQDTNVSALRKVMDQRWGELMTKYEEEKRANPDFAVPPGDEALPKAAPVKLWQKGVNEWHVDAPLVVTQDRVIVASAYLDDDKCGKRAVMCLDRKTGEMLWERAVDINPWAGVTVEGDMVLVGCSTVRFDKNTAMKGKGAVVAMLIQTGAVEWERYYTGGVLSAVAVRDGVGVFATTDGVVHAVSLKNGKDRWAYKAPEVKEPFFAGVAIAGGMDNGGVVYAADLGGVLHAISLTDGKGLWTYAVGRDPIVQAPGMVFGAPLVRGNQIILATCNVQGDHADQPCAVVAVADKNYNPNTDGRPKVTVDKEHRRLVIPARMAPRKLPSLKDIYPLEVVCTWPTPMGQKAHETVVITEVKPSEVQAGLETLGLKAGHPSHGQEEPTGPEVTMSLVLTGVNGKERVVPIERTIIDKTTGRTLGPLVWRFTGSASRQLDPDNPDMAYGADMGGTFATIYPVTDETVIQGNLSMGDQSALKLELNRNVVPEENTPVKLWIEVK